MTKYRYPVSQNHSDIVHTATGIKLEDVNLEAVMEGWINPGDLTISSDTLLIQAEVAEEAGYPQLAENLRRAAELVFVPADRILHIYNALRPHRSTYEELELLADELEKRYEAEAITRMIREAAEAYRTRELLRSED